MHVFFAALLLASGMDASPRPDVGVLEINTFGWHGSERTALIFREEGSGDILDWRWGMEISSDNLKKEPFGLYVLEWKDRGGAKRRVRIREIARTRTLHDVEAAEQDLLPRHMRKGLPPHEKPSE